MFFTSTRLYAYIIMSKQTTNIDQNQAILISKGKSRILWKWNDLGISFSAITSVNLWTHKNYPVRNATFQFQFRHLPILTQNQIQILYLSPNWQ